MMMIMHLPRKWAVHPDINVFEVKHAGIQRSSSCLVYGKGIMNRWMQGKSLTESTQTGSKSEARLSPHLAHTEFVELFRAVINFCN